MNETLRERIHARFLMLVEQADEKELVTLLARARNAHDHLDDQDFLTTVNLLGQSLRTVRERIDRIRDPSDDELLRILLDPENFWGASILLKLYQWSHL
ncbi:MAG: hypothetical protein Q8K86_07015 [Candidatus Nanopelagicaceae bacterium]|nr:hypothetical protein [Candidatus Nanopelagicaceae bacterium]